MWMKMPKRIAGGVAAGLVSAVMVVAPVAASTLPAPATSLQAASAPLSGWVDVQPGMTQWYKFKYHYDDSKSSNEPTQAMVDLKMETASCAAFEVWTPGRLRAPLPDPDKQHQEGTVRVAVGQGTPAFVESIKHHDKQNPQHKDVETVTDPSHLVWVGSARASDTYYVAVKNRSNNPCAYDLTIRGPDVSF